MRALWFVVPLFTFACSSGTPSTDDTGTDDTAPVDTDPVDPDASGWVIDSTATQVLEATIVVGERSQDGDFTDVVEHNVVTVEEESFRQFFGRVNVPNPTEQGPEQVQFELRLVVPEDDFTTGPRPCLGASSGYGVFVSFYGPNEDVPVQAFASVDPEVGDSCTIDVKAAALKRYSAEISSTTLRNLRGNPLELENIRVDVQLVEE